MLSLYSDLLRYLLLLLFQLYGSPELSKLPCWYNYHPLENNYIVMYLFFNKRLHIRTETLLLRKSVIES